MPWVVEGDDDSPGTGRTTDAGTVLCVIAPPAPSTAPFATSRSIHPGAARSAR